MCTADAGLIAREVYSECSKVFPGRIRDAYLYGSYARGFVTKAKNECQKSAKRRGKLVVLAMEYSRALCYNMVQCVRI